MEENTGIIRVIQLDEDGNRSASIEIQDLQYPTPGNYLLGHNPSDQNEVLSIPLFPVGLNSNLGDHSHPILGPIPKSWKPGTRLELIGPVGKGFRLPGDVRRLALVTISGSIARLLPLVNPSIIKGVDITIFTPNPLKIESLPLSVEIHHLDALPENLPWATFMAIDTPLSEMRNLRGLFGLSVYEKIPCPAQVLVQIPMPCGGLGECGVCAVPAKKGRYKMACVDGPVFDTNVLRW